MNDSYLNDESPICNIQYKSDVYSANCFGFKNKQDLMEKILISD